MAVNIYKKLGRRSRKGLRVRIVDLLRRYEKYIAVEIPRNPSLLTILSKNGVTVVSKNGKTFAILPIHGNILRELEEILEKDIMTRYMNNKTEMTRKVIKKINQKSLTILQRFRSGDGAQAVQAYKKILEQCMACHQETRNW